MDARHWALTKVILSLSNEVTTKFETGSFDVIQGDGCRVRAITKVEMKCTPAQRAYQRRTVGAFTTATAHAVLITSKSRLEPKPKVSGRRHLTLTTAELAPSLSLK